MGDLVPPTALSDRISPEYLAVQRDLHESSTEYGTTGAMRARAVLKVMNDIGAHTVLDYGCGKGLLKQAIQELDPASAAVVREYDPAIPGKDAEPERADLVVCTDVLEHIEPEKLPNVLEHIRCLGDWMAFVISTRAALKTLPDGRNAHILLRTPEWWREELSKCFDIQNFDIQDNGISVIAKPFIVIGEIKGVGVMDYSKRLEHIRKNIKVTSKRIKPPKFMYWYGNQPPMFGIRMGTDKGLAKWAIPMPHNRVAIICCYGPSLNDTWENVPIEAEEIQNADIVSVSGAHDFLIDRGIIPKYHIECDPRPHKWDMMRKVKNKIEYLMASVVAPEIIQKLKKKRLTIWHMNEGEPSLQILELEPNSPLIPGGGSVGLRSIALLYMMGYRRFLIHGMDCSYRDGEGHAGKHTGKKPETVEVRCVDGRRFTTAPVLITYKRYFDELRRAFCGDADTDASKIEIILRGDGLLQHWLRLSGGAESYQQKEVA